MSQPRLANLLASLPGGDHSFWGVPFGLLPTRVASRWVWIGPEVDGAIAIELHGLAEHVLVAHFSVPSHPISSGTDSDAQLDGVPLEQGEHLADYVLLYADGAEHRTPIRRHFEIGDVSSRELAFAARPHQEASVLDWRGPHDDGRWGVDQQGTDGPLLVNRSRYERGVDLVPHYWIYALRNPRSEAPLAGLRLESRGSTPIALAGISLYSGGGDPLRHRRLETLRVDLPPGGNDATARVDLGMVARQIPVASFDADAWCDAADLGNGSPPRAPSVGDRAFVVEVAASDGATLEVANERISLSEVFAAGVAGSDAGHVRVRLLTPERRWVAVSIVDSASETPMPARVHFRSADGRYLPPNGHRHEVNDRWFEDYGADLQLGGMAYAYVDGRFDIELPLGDVYVEVVKGFEYTPVRARVQVGADTTDLTLRLERAMDWRKRGWIAADTHVHFLSPETASLEAQAEGVNIVNLLASQWGDLYTNFADLTGRPSGVSRDDTLIWVGTENRQHVLGHMSLLGISRAAAPVCAGGPSESFIGDPVWSSLSEWADLCHEQDGIVVVPHFPTPYCENVANVILGKVDAVEVRDFEWGVNTYAVREWYRLLNCGYRVAAVGGTDKMSAGIPVGGVRTYAQIGGAELSFGAWAKAVRAGRTVTTSGPLIELTVEGRSVGDSLEVQAGGGTLSVEARATALQPLSLLEIVHNGRVIARADGEAGVKSLRLKADLRVSGGGWIAARCMGPTVQWHVWPVQTAAHTSPVYLVGRADPGAHEADLVHLSTILDGGLAWLDALATRADDARHAQVRQVFLDARDRIKGDLTRRRDDGRDGGAA